MSTSIRKVSQEVTRDLLCHVSDFLSYNDFPETLAALQKEKEAKRNILSSSLSHPMLSNDQRGKLLADLVSGNFDHST